MDSEAVAPEPLLDDDAAVHRHLIGRRRVDVPDEIGGERDAQLDSVRTTTRMRPHLVCGLIKLIRSLLRLLGTDAYASISPRSKKLTYLPSPITT